MSRARRVLLALAALAVIGLGAHFVAYLLYLARLRNPPPLSGPVPSFRHVDPETLGALGWVGADRSSAFGRFELEKPDGVERIGCFGDSFTWGDEAADGLDYPALLDREFAQAGRPEVEVLNFGSNWYGFHQSYLLWESVGTRFDLDAVVLGPSSFQEDRDTTFNHTGDFEAGAIHARYVLDGDGVRRIDVLGETPYRRYRRYYAYWTPATYRRFDRRAPVFLRCLFPESRFSRNPFYYFDGAIEEEAHETYRRLLRRMAARERRVVLVHHRPEIVELAGALGLPNLLAAVAPRPLHFPYVAPRGHGSPAANRLLARQVLGLLAGEPEPGGTVLRTTDPPEPAIASRVASAAPGILVEAGGKEVGHLYRMGSGGFPERVETWDPTRTLLAIRGEGQSVLDGLFVPLEGDLEPASLRLRHPDSEEVIPLGTPKRLADDGPIAVLTLPGATVALHTHLGLKAYLDFPTTGPPIASLELRVGGATHVGRSEPPSHWVPLEVPLTETLFLRAAGDVLLEEGAAGPRTFDLVWPIPDGEVRLPIARW